MQVQSDGSTRVLASEAVLMKFPSAAFIFAVVWSEPMAIG